jgi:hypothetical protein
VLKKASRPLTSSFERLYLLEQKISAGDGSSRNRAWPAVAGSFGLPRERRIASPLSGASPDFKERFHAFVARADEYLDVVRPFFAVLVQFLPAHKEFRTATEPRRIEAAAESDLTTEVA